MEVHHKIELDGDKWVVVRWKW